MVNNGVFEAFGLRVKSDIFLPELINKTEDISSFDINIKVDQSLKTFYIGNPYDFIAEANMVSFLIPDVGVFRIIDGKEILVSPFENANEDIVRLYLLGSCFGTLLLQRGTYILHGSAVVIDNKAYAIVGDSGAGKSTLASAFMERGYSLLSDDVIALSFKKNEQNPQVIPSYPQQKLWQQSLDKFGLNNTTFRPIYGREDKFCIPVMDQYCSEPMPLDGIFELVKMSSGPVTFRPLQGLEQLQKLFQHTYRQFLIPKLKLTEWHFRKSASLASNLPLYQISRPIEGFSAYQIVEEILETINQKASLTLNNKMKKTAAIG